jgi:hypothetical protein
LGYLEYGSSSRKIPYTKKITENSSGLPELPFSKRLSQSPIEIKIIGVLNEEFFRLIRLFKRDSDRERDHEKKAIER